MTPNEYQIKDKINQLKFEIEQLKRRKQECGTDAGCIDKVCHLITAKETELNIILNPTDNTDDKIDSDNNEYRERDYGEGDE